MHGSCFLGVMELFLRSYGVILEELKELRSYHSLRSLGVKPILEELRSYHSLCSLGVKPILEELWS